MSVKKNDETKNITDAYVANRSVGTTATNIIIDFIAALFVVSDLAIIIVILQTLNTSPGPGVFLPIGILPLNIANGVFARQICRIFPKRSPLTLLIINIAIEIVFIVISASFLTIIDKKTSCDHFVEKIFDDLFATLFYLLLFTLFGKIYYFVLWAKKPVSTPKRV